MAAALLFFIPEVGASAADPLFGIFYADQFTATGSVVQHATDWKGFLLAKNATGAFTWTLDASELTLNITERRWLVQGRPTDPSRPGTSMALEEPRSSERILADAQAFSTATEPSATLLGRPLFVSGFAFESGGSPLTVRAAPEKLWLAGQADPDRAGNALSPSLAIPPGSVTASATFGLVRLDGSFSLYVWGTNLTVQQKGQRETIRTGAWISSTPTGSEYGTWERTERLVRIDIEKGDLDLRLLGRHATWASPSVQINGTWDAAARNATGFVQHRSTNVSLMESPVIMQGVGSFDAWNQTVGRIGVHVDLDEAQFDAPNAKRIGRLISPEYGPVVEAEVSGPLDQAYRLWGTFALVLACSGYVAIRRSRRVHPIEDVEFAILSGRLARGRRWSRRLARAYPDDPDVLFLYGSLLLGDRQHERVLRELEPAAKRMPTRSRLGLAYLLASAAYAQNDVVRAKQWAQEVAVAPQMMARLPAALRAFGPASSWSAAYA